MRNEPDTFVGRKIRPDAADLGWKVLNKDNDEKVVYGIRMTPENADEFDSFLKASALAYELYVTCGPDGTITEINHRVEQGGCSCCGGGRSFAPSSAPAWLFPAGAMFDLDWSDIAYVARQRMQSLLAEMALPKPRMARRVAKAATGKTAPPRRQRQRPVRP